MEALLRALDRVAGPPGRAALRAWARPGYFEGPLVATPLRRLLVLACAWVGDTLWDVQVLPALEEALPEAEVHVATRRRGAALVAHLPRERRHLLDHVPSDRRREPVDRAALAREAAVLRGVGWDLVVDLTGNRYSAAFAFLTRPRASLGFGAAPLGWLYTVRAAPPREHLSRRPWRVVEPIVGRVADPPPPRLFAAAAAAWPRGAGAPLDRADGAGAPLDRAGAGLAPDAPLALLAPGAGWPGKRWPAERFAALAARLRDEGLTVVVTGAPAERELVRSVASPAGAAQLVGDDLGAVIAVAARARVVVSNDSGVAHLAAAAGAPVVALYSATNPAICGPLGPHVTVLTGACPARPTGAQHHCHGTAGFACPASCWDALSVERVLEAALSACAGARTAPR